MTSLSKEKTNYIYSVTHLMREMLPKPAEEENISEFINDELLSGHLKAIRALVDSSEESIDQ